MNESSALLARSVRFGGNDAFAAGWPGDRNPRSERGRDLATGRHIDRMRLKDLGITEHHGATFVKRIRTKHLDGIF